MRLITLLLVAVAVLALPTAAHAQVAWPFDAAWVPMRCGDAVMTDGFADESGATNERDIVGDGGAPAGYRAADDTNLFLRMRLEEDPAPGGAVTSFSWGMEFDTDNDATDYELLVLVDGLGGAAGSVQVFRNTSTTLANDPSDPADQPAVATYTFANNARTVAAPGSSFGGGADFFLDFAVPWADLVPLGLDRDTPVRVWVASSSSPNSLNGDFACHDGASASDPTLDGTASDPTTGDPNEDPGGGIGGGRLEGGGGCAVANGPVSPLSLFGLALVLALVMTRRRGASR